MTDNWTFTAKDANGMAEIVAVRADDTVVYAAGMTPGMAWRAAGTRLSMLEGLIDDLCQIMAIDRDHATAIAKHGEVFRHQLLRRSVARVQSHHAMHHQREAKMEEALDRLSTWFMNAGADDFNNVEPVDSDNALELIEAALNDQEMPVLGEDGYPLTRSKPYIAKIQDLENTVQLLQAKLREVART